MLYFIKIEITTTTVTLKQTWTDKAILGAKMKMKTGQQKKL